MTTLEQAKFLQTNYKNYPLYWYTTNPARTKAIYKRVWSSVMNRLHQKEQAKLDERLERLKIAYFEHYGVDYDSDLIEWGRPYVHERSMLIRKDWV